MGDVTSLRIRLLGGLEVEGIQPAALGSRKGRTVLKRLALSAGEPVGTDTLVDVLWPDGGAPAKPAEQVSVHVSRLRRVLGGSAITFADGGYTLTCDWLDLDELSQRVEESARRLDEGSATSALAAATAALALVRGPLLPDETDAVWAEAARGAVDRLVTRARHVAAASALAVGLAWDAAEHAAAAVSADAYDEAALRLLMRAHVATGRPALALAVYAEAARVVADELGADLAAETQALHVAILRGEASGPLAAAPSSAAAVLAGRDRELADLDMAFARASAGQAGVVVVDGEAGIGKSRLLDAFGASLAGRADVLSGSADATGVLPLEPILDALARRLAAAPDDEQARVLGGDRDLLGPLLRPGGAGSGADPAVYRDVLSAYEPGEQSASAVLHLAVLATFARLTEQQPVVVLLDDMHLADPATIAWLGLVARRGAGLRLLVVAARRAGDGDAPTGAELVTVGRLGRDAVAAIVVPIAGADVDEAWLDELYERSDGNPLFLVELAHATGDTLPDSVRQAVVDRMTDAGPASATLHAAAVLGREVDVDLLATVLGRPANELLDELEEGRARRLLVDAATGYVFRHEIVREALDADTPSARRAWLHREAAQALSSRVPVDQMLVAHHARLGGDTALAAEALSAAAVLAASRFDHEEAVRLADESLGYLDSADAHVVKARSLILLRRYDEARAEATAAASLGAGPPALEVAAYAAYYARDLDAVVRFADEASATTADPDVHANCQLLAAKVLLTTGHTTEVVDRLTAVVTAMPAPTIKPFVSVWLSLAHLHRGRLEDAERELRDSDRAMSLPVPYAALYVEQIRGHYAGLAGRPLDALAAATRLQASAAAQHAERFAGRAEVYLGWALGLLCSPRAADALEEARTVARDHGNPEPLGQGSLDLARLFIDGGNLDGAGRLLEEVAALTAAQSVSNGWRLDLRRRYLEGRLAVAARDIDGAITAAGDIQARSAVDDLERYAVLGELLEAEARAVAGRTVDVDRITGLVTRAGSVARPEAWSITARLAVALDSTLLRTVAIRHVEDLIAVSGEYADTIRATAAKTLT